MSEQTHAEQARQIRKDSQLKWEFDGSGGWDAWSMIMDPEMTDIDGREPKENWCKEWCLWWHIEVMEDGAFFAGNGMSDGLLLEGRQIATKTFNNLSHLQAVIDLIESGLRNEECFDNGRAIQLLPIEKYRT